MRKELLLLALLGMGSVHAAPKCDTDTFTEEKSCVYGRGSIGMAGIGIEGEGRRVEEAEVKRGGRMFARFLADIQEHEPELLTP